jgi:hypothetical protein
MSRRLSPELRDFIFRFCPSVLLLEVLLLLRAHSDRTWTPAELRREMPDLDEPHARDLLAGLYAQELLAAASVEHYQFGPRSPEVARLVDYLAAAYLERPAAVLEEISALAGLAPIRSFADAFLIKKERKRG